MMLVLSSWTNNSWNGYDDDGTVWY
jgi:hypothetical protein